MVDGNVCWGTIGRWIVSAGLDEDSKKVSR